MHSRIFQISKQPIEKEDYFTENRYYDHFGFIGRTGMDYVDDCTDREDDIDWLSCVSGIDVNVEEETFEIKSKEMYFRGAYHDFMKNLYELKNMTLKEFIENKKALAFYRLESAYSDVYSFWFDCKDVGLLPQDEFMRYAKEGDKYYIGATIDYHF